MSMQQTLRIPVFLVLVYLPCTICQTNANDWKRVFEHAIEQDSAKNSNTYSQTKAMHPLEIKIVDSLSTAYKFDIAIGRVKTTGGNITSLIYLLLKDAHNDCFLFISSERDEDQDLIIDENKWQLLDRTVYKSFSDSARFFICLNNAYSFGGFYELYFYSRENHTLAPYSSIQTVTIASTPDNYLIDGNIQTGGPIEVGELYKLHSNSDFLKYLKSRFHPSLYDAIAIKNDGISLRIDPVNLNNQSPLKKYIGKIQYNIDIGMRYAAFLPGYYELINFPKVASFPNENERDLKKTKSVEKLYQSLLKEKPWLIDSINLTFFNDIGYFLEQSNKYQAAIDVLSEVIEKFPMRTPAYLNLGDAYTGLKNSDKASENYKKYIELMKKEGKEKKIPQRVMERVK
ncbi:MAG TPA: tetratricopeptide repeat protein [Chitinispirillaceae bacterium]|nr:tetratricopeptide repeat protein [Chitinispirillaceae bacterium]